MTTIEIKKRINDAFDKLFVCDIRENEVSERPPVCIICDEFIASKHFQIISVESLAKHGHILCPTVVNNVNNSSTLRMHYEVNDLSLINPIYHAILRSMLLSPRASYLHYEDGRRTSGFTCCSKCKASIHKGYVPKFAIANNYCFGCPPQCLLDLTDVELALLTPVKTYGYCFTYTGGKQRNLKGNLTYYKVRQESIARAIMHFDVLNLSQNVVVLLNGKLTPDQKQKAKSKNKVRTEFLLTALSWLVNHNEEWKRCNIDLEVVRQNLSNPVLIDNSQMDDSECNNVESTETFQVFFPDGSMCSATGGQANIERFQQLVEQCKVNAFDLEFQNDLSKEAVREFKDNNLVNAFLLQFPYGRGGMHERRYYKEGSMSSSTKLEEYVQHLSRLSLPHFQQDLFVLVLYNIQMKQKMFKTAIFKTRGKFKAQALSEELTEEGVHQAISRRRNESYCHDTSGRLFLQTIDAITKSAPHTNGAAKAAMRDGEALQHHFGIPSYFFTVTPDDDNSFLLQVYSGTRIDQNVPVSSLTDEMLEAKAKERTTLRIKYPGVCALLFEEFLRIIIEEVIGWNMKDNTARSDKRGLFGEPTAFIASIEEQGRRTLHVHFQIWVNQFNNWRDALHSSSTRIRESAEKLIVELTDVVSTCELVNPTDDWNMKYRMRRAFDHPCTIPS